MATRTKPAADPLSEDALQHFKTYKYSAIDKSPLSHHVFRHYWNACVEFLPLWLAPNMVTLLGFFFIIGNVGLLELVDPDFLGPKQAWVCYSYAFGVWAYSTMDNIDGKQARRTDMSSGLGELFDHGIDSLNCTLASLFQVSVMGLGASPVGALTAIIPTLPMYFSTWETYHTHTLFLGYVNGPTEGLALSSLTLALTGWFGKGMWYRPLADVVGFEGVLGELNVLDVWVPFILVAFFAGHLPSCVYNVWVVRREKGLPFAPTLLGWIPMIVFTAAFTAWLGSPYSTLLRDNHLALMSLTLSFVFGRMTTKVILAHLTRQPFPYWTALLVPLIGGAVLVNLPYLGFEAVSAETEHYYLWAYFVLATAVYFRWAYLVITAICNYLGIPCLTVPEEKWRALEAERKKNR